MSAAKLWEESESEGMKSSRKGPKAGTRLAYLEAANVARAKQINKKLEGNKDGETNSRQIMEDI